MWVEDWVRILDKNAQREQRRQDLICFWREIETPVMGLGIVTVIAVALRRFGWKKVLVVSGIIMAVSLWEAARDDLVEME